MSWDTFHLFLWMSLDQGEGTLGEGVAMTEVV